MFTFTRFSKTLVLLIVCCVALISTRLMSASNSAVSAEALNTHAGAQQGHQPGDCGGEPCDAVVRGLRAFFDRRLHGLDGNGRSCADCHMATNHFQLSPANAEARFRILQWRRQWNPNADDPLFRPIDADDFRINGEDASDFSNLRQNGLVRIVFPLPPTIRLIDPATNLPSTEAFADVWRMVPTVNDVALTGPDGVNPWPRGPNSFGGYQLDARVATLQEQALYIEFFKRVKANAAPGVVPPIATTDGVNFDRRPTPEERESLLAYLRKL